MLLAGALLIWQAAIHDVPTSLTPDDVEVARGVLGPLGLSPVDDPLTTWSYDRQLSHIRTVEHTLIHLTPNNDPIPLGQAREPRDLLAFGGGLCYDRSRTIEKLLRYLGFATRHASIYAMPPGTSALHSLMTPGIDSHAVTEVKTSRGWLIVSSVDNWVSEDSGGQPISLARMQEDASQGVGKRMFRDGAPSFILAAPFTYVIGLYSRHGRFYPPYDSVPNISLREALVLSWM